MSSSAAAPRRRRPLWSLPPTEAIDLGSGLSLAPRLRLLLTFFRSDPAVKPVDEWKLKLALLDFLRAAPLSLVVPEDDLRLRRRPDLHKRKRDEPVASGTIVVRELGFLKNQKEEDEEEEDVVRKRFLEWRSSVLEKLGGIELNIEGVMFRMTVELPSSDVFEQMKKSWEDFYASQLLNIRSYPRGVARQPDTIIVTGVPSRWFAEPRVSSKPSMLVTHTIFSVLGKIRNLNVAGDDDLGKKTEEAQGEILSGLHCKVWVQFETYDDFYNALKVLCGRSMRREGSNLKVDYEVTWDKDGYFRHAQQKPARSQLQERDRPTQALAGYIKTDVVRHESQDTSFNSDRVRPKRFRD